MHESQGREDRLSGLQNALVQRVYLDFRLPGRAATPSVAKGAALLEDGAQLKLYCMGSGCWGVGDTHREPSEQSLGFSSVGSDKID